MRLLRLGRMRWQDRGHFLAMAARVMRQVLIDDSRRDLAQKRGGLRVHTTWMDERGMSGTGADAVAPDQGVDLERLDAAMRDLSSLSPARA